MFKYDKDQTIVEVAGMKCGGQPGEYPTVLAGTIFYAGHKIIKDELNGEFDKDKAEELIKNMEEMEDTTGNPCIIQCFGATPEAIKNYLEFIGDISDKPFLIDSTSGETRAVGAQYAQESGLTNDNIQLNKHVLRTRRTRSSKKHRHISIYHTRIQPNRIRSNGKSKHMGQWRNSNGPRITRPCKRLRN